jgi:hypothetical protein
VTHVCTLPPLVVLLPKLLTFCTYYSCAGTIVGSYMQSHTTYSVCFHDDQYICFNPIYRHQEQWLEVGSFTSIGKLVNRTQGIDPNKPVSMYYDMCAAIAENTRPSGNCGGLAWERTYRSNDKYIRPKDNSGTSGCASYEQLYYPLLGL